MNIYLFARSSHTCSYRLRFSLVWLATSASVSIFQQFDISVSNSIFIFNNFNILFRKTLFIRFFFLIFVTS